MANEETTNQEEPQFPCEHCGEPCKSKAGLSAHKRFNHQEKKPIRKKKFRGGPTPGVDTFAQLTPEQDEEIRSKGFVPRMVNASNSIHAKRIMTKRLAQGYKPYKLKTENPLMKELYGESSTGGSRFGEDILMVCSKESYDGRRQEIREEYKERMRQRKGFKRQATQEAGLEDTNIVYGPGITTEVEQ